MAFVEYLVRIRGDLLLRTWEHLLLAVGSTAIAVGAAIIRDMKEASRIVLIS